MINKYDIDYTFVDREDISSNIPRSIVTMLQIKNNKEVLLIRDFFLSDDEKLNTDKIKSFCDQFPSNIILYIADSEQADRSIRNSAKELNINRLSLVSHKSHIQYGVYIYPNNASAEYSFIQECINMNDRYEHCVTGNIYRILDNHIVTSDSIQIDGVRSTAIRYGKILNVLNASTDRYETLYRYNDKVFRLDENVGDIYVMYYNVENKDILFIRRRDEFGGYHVSGAKRFKIINS